MQTHREKICDKVPADEHMMCVEVGLIVAAPPLCSEAAIQLPERGSPAALIISFIYQRWFHTPVNIKLIISNKQVNKPDLHGPPQMNLWVHNRIGGNYINAGVCGV